MGDVRFAADAPVRIAGCRGTFTAFLAGPDIPALFRRGALEFPQKVDFRVGCSTAPCSGRGPLGRGDTQSALGFSGENEAVRMEMAHRAIFFPDFEHGMY